MMRGVLTMLTEPTAEVQSAVPAARAVAQTPVHGEVRKPVTAKRAPASRGGVGTLQGFREARG